MRAVSLSLGKALDALAGAASASTRSRRPPLGGCIHGPHISVALQQKTANFKAAILSREMQWSELTEGTQKNQFAARK